jgi:hypothetical protein
MKGFQGGSRRWQLTGCPVRPPTAYLPAWTITSAPPAPLWPQRGIARPQRGIARPASGVSQPARRRRGAAACPPEPYADITTTARTTAQQSAAHPWRSPPAGWRRGAAAGETPPRACWPPRRAAPSRRRPCGSCGEWRRPAGAAAQQGSGQRRTGKHVRRRGECS